MPHPMTIRTLLERYNCLQLRHEQDPSDDARRKLEDVTYTLCVSTGTLTIRDALAAADLVLHRAAVDQAVHQVPSIAAAARPIANAA